MSIVQSLQAECLGQAHGLPDLLRKVKLVATKLKLPDTVEWVRQELSGYNNSEDIPSYRTVRGLARWFNPMLGWRPIVFDDPDLMSRASTQPIGNPISQIEAMARQASDDGALTLQTPAWLMEAAAKNMGELVDVRIFVDRSEMHRIEQAVRDRILDWALELERQGIMGEGVTFTSEEAKKARDSMVVYNIGSIGSVAALGSISGEAQVSVNSTTGIMTLAELAALVKALRWATSEFDADDRAKVEVELATIDRELETPEPSRSKIRGALTSIFASVKANAKTLGGWITEAAVKTSIDKLMSGR